MRNTFENFVGRRFLLVLMAALLAFGTVACGDDAKDDENNHKGHVHEDAGNDTDLEADAVEKTDVEVDVKDEVDAPEETDAAENLDGLEVEGTWTSNWGGEEEITETQWGFNPLVKYDNAERVAYTKNADDAEYNPGKYGKIVWTPIVDDSFYYCTVEFALDTLEDAVNSTTPADATNPEEEGCGGFAWTTLTRK